MKKYNIFFDGYWRDVKKNKLPECEGIYLVYRCIYNEIKKNVTLKELIYIGQTDNIHDRIINHERYEDFIKELKYNEQLCYSYTPIKVAEDRDVIENALIFMQKTRLNDKLKDKYIYSDAIFIFEGKCTLLNVKAFKLSSNMTNGQRITTIVNVTDF